MSNFAPAAEAAVQILTFLACSERELGLSEISRGTGINKNMVFRILGSLEKEGWVYGNGQKYALTLLPFCLSAKAVARTTLNSVSLPLLYQLREETGESTYLGILKEDTVLYLQHLDGAGNVRVAGSVGGRYELYCSAPGKVLLAFAEEDFREEYLSREHERKTVNTIVEKEALSEELCHIREAGFATDREEFGNGISCVASPIFDYSGKVVAAVGCSAFTPHGQSDAVIDKLLPAVCRTAKEISTRLGSLNR